MYLYCFHKNCDFGQIWVARDEASRLEGTYPITEEHQHLTDGTGHTQTKTTRKPAPILKEEFPLLPDYIKLEHGMEES